MRMLVTGGRDFEDEAFLFATLDRLHAERAVTLLIHGGARGADRLAAAWAEQRGIPVLVRQADWMRHGRGAGMVRNRQMLKDHPDLVVAFPGGPGTADMIRIAEKAGLDVVVAEPP